MKRLPVLLAALALAGCGAEAEQSSAEKFTGEERAVAQKVEDLQEAGEGRNPEDICSDILASSLVQQLEAAGVKCADEMEKAIDDADDYDLAGSGRDGLRLDRHRRGQARRRRADRDHGVHEGERPVAGDVAEQLGPLRLRRHQ